MAHLPNLITDLALILGAAAIITFLFKWLKQPIPAEFLALGFLFTEGFFNEEIPFDPNIYLFYVVNSLHLVLVYNRYSFRRI